MDSNDAAGDAVGSGFLSLPMPRSIEENQLYYELTKSALLDIVEVLPVTSPRSWVYRDGSPVTWFNWADGEPSSPSKAHYVEFGFKTPTKDHGARWNDVTGPSSRPRRIVCTYFLPAGAELVCPWLNDFQDQEDSTISGEFIGNQGYYNHTEFA